MTEITHPHRSHTCGELRTEHVGQTVRLCGWVYRHREQKHHVFVDLRDHYGVTQLAFVEDQPEVLELARSLKPESVIRVDGEVVTREHANPKLETGQIEVKVTRLEVESAAGVLPIQVQIPKGESDLADEENRLTWRFLDLRRERLHRNVVVRDRVIQHMRAHMAAEGFVEVQTPILTNSSPEGARDYLVPSRVHPGKFFALPQAPQQWKQLLMTSGFDKYFQIAPCFRDEDARADRAPGEFYQLDMEMAFVEQDDVFGVIERLYRDLPERVPVPGMQKKRLQEFPFPRIPYWESIDRFGSDKPDLRYGRELVDVSDLFQGTGFGLFADALGLGGRVKALRVAGGAKAGKGYVRKLEKHVKQLGYGGLPHLIYKAGEVDGSIKKPTSAEEQAAVKERLGCEDGDLVVFGCGTQLAAASVLGQVRTQITADLMDGLVVRDVTESFLKTRLDRLAAPIKAGGYAKAIRVPSRLLEGDGLEADALVADVPDGVAAVAAIWGKQGPDGDLKQALPKNPKDFQKHLGAEAGDLVIVLGGPLEEVVALGSRIRGAVCEARDLPDPDVLGFCFIVDYPFYELDDEGKVDFSHNPFSMPQGGMAALEGDDPLAIKAWQYDICCNGIELSSGAIRNHRPDVMFKAFELVGYSRQETETEFGHMIRAFSYGAPPHGGMAPGVERTVMLLLDEPNIREVVAFPKNQRCQDLLASAPSFVRDEQLKELNLRLVLDESLGRCPSCSEANQAFEHVDVHGYRIVCCEACKPTEAAQ
jgi:aspartyl-tRNA synthetase